MIIMPTDQALPHREARSDGVYAPRKGDQHELLAQQLLVCAEHRVPLDARFSHDQKRVHDNALDLSWENQLESGVGREHLRQRQARRADAPDACKQNPLIGRSPWRREHEPADRRLPHGATPSALPCYVTLRPPLCQSDENPYAKSMSVTTPSGSSACHTCCVNSTPSLRQAIWAKVVPTTIKMCSSSLKRNSCRNRRRGLGRVPGNGLAVKLVNPARLDDG